MLDIRLCGQSGGVFADDERNGAMRVDVVSAILRVVFENKNGSVIPIWAVRNRIDDASESQVIVGYVGCRARTIGARSSGMVVGEIEQDKRRQLELRALVGLVRAHVRAEFVQEFIGTELVGIVGIEVRIERIEVISEHGLSRLDSAEKRNRPWPRADASVGS